MTYPAIDIEGDVWYDGEDLMAFTSHFSHTLTYFMQLLPVTLTPVDIRPLPNAQADYYTPIWHEDA